MKTLQECKDEVAVKHGFVTWPALMIHHNLSTLSSSTISILVDESVDVYSSQFIEELKTLKADYNTAWDQVKSLKEENERLKENNIKSLIDLVSENTSLQNTNQKLESELLKAKELLISLRGHSPSVKDLSTSFSFQKSFRDAILEVDNYLKTTAPVEQTKKTEEELPTCLQYSIPAEEVDQPEESKEKCPFCGGKDLIDVNDNWTKCVDCCQEFIN